MSDGANTGNMVDPVELWRQWNETTATLWTSALDSTRQAYGSGAAFMPKGTGNTGSPDENYLALFTNLKDIWQVWLDATMEIWQQAVGKGGPQAALAAQWLKMMEQAQAKLQAGEVLPIDPFTLFRDWYNASSGEWAKSIESMLGSEKFLQASGPLMESYAGVMRAFRLASEAYFKKLQLPTLSDLSRVAELVIALEEKVDKIDDQFEDVEHKFAGVASNASVAGLQERLKEHVDQLAGRFDAIEQKLGSVASSASLTALQERLNQTATDQSVGALSEQVQQFAGLNTSVASLQERLDQTATNQVLGDLSAQVQQFADGDRVAQLEQRLAGVEEKLDVILSHLEHSSTKKPASTPATQVRRTRKTPKKDVE